MRKILVFLVLCCFFSGCSSPPSKENQVDFTKEDLLSSLELAGNYLVRETREDGSFVYLYNASCDCEDEDYNILRHAGTIYAMLQLYQVTENKDLLPSNFCDIHFHCMNNIP